VPLLAAWEPLPFDPGHATVGHGALEERGHEPSGLLDRWVIVVGMDVGLVAEAAGVLGLDRGADHVQIVVADHQPERGAPIRTGGGHR